MAMAMVKPTPHSSDTMLDRQIQEERVDGAPQETRPMSPLDTEIAEAELALEKYGGDDIHEPAPKESIDAPTAPPNPFAPKPVDPNMVTWDGPDDQENPQNWPDSRKWLITVICALLTVNVSFASSAPTSATFSIIAQFDISSEVSYLLTTMFLLGYVFGPLFWGPGSELFGRRPVFLLTMSVYTLFHLGQALAQNIETLLITRFLGGFFACAPLTNCGGVIADIWPAVGRGPATSIFTASVFLGPVLGPIISGYIVESYLSWRWVFWIMMIFAGACTIIMAILLPETYVPIILLKKAKRLRKADPEGSKHIYAEHEKQDWSIPGLTQRYLYRPVHMLMLEPILVLVTIYLSIVYGLLYALFEAFPVIFMEKRGLTIAQNGLMFIGVGIGATSGSLFNFFATSHYRELIVKWRGFPPPEQRLFGGMLGGPLLVIGIFWLGWTGEYSSIGWYVPDLSSILIGAAISLIFMSFLSYLIDTYLMYSASAFAANTVVRSAVAAAFPLFTVQMFENLGVNWACTLLGLIALVFAPSPFLFYKYGPRVRARSKFAPCIDLHIAKELKAEEEAAAVKNKGLSEKV